MPPLSYTVRKGRESAKRLAEKYMPSAEGGAACEALAAIREQDYRIKDLEGALNSLVAELLSAEVQPWLSSSAKDAVDTAVRVIERETN